MKKVVKTSLPVISSLHARIEPTDFLDCYCIESEMSARAAAEIAFDPPAWTDALMKLRNVLVSPWGLTTVVSEDVETAGMFPIDTETEHELVVGFDDKHLNFRISVVQHMGHVYFATWVHTNNIGGRLYLGAIFPFHILIVRNALSRVGAITP